MDPVKTQGVQVWEAPTNLTEARGFVGFLNFYRRQWLEQYLQHICNLQQDNWAEALPLAQFAHNAWPNATTKETPFSLIMGWMPRVTWTNPPSAAPSADRRMEELQIKRQHVQDSIAHTQLMAKRGNSTFTPYQLGAMVWLEGVNL